MREPPFPIGCQLEDILDVLSQPNTDKCTATGRLRLPSQPHISITDDAKIRRHLAKEFLLKDLELLSPRLWMMAKQDSKSISPLHRQIVKQRTIVVTEDPRLHLVWYHDRIFVKPLPRYLLSHKFWETFLCTESSTYPPENEHSRQIDAVRRAILGYVRTYALLIKHESDFSIATRTDLQLVPKDVTFAAFCDFICHFEATPNAAVAGRYAFGELRLSRLNFYCIFFLGTLSFHRMHPQYSDFFSRFYAPMLFTFGVFSIVLNAMQVGLSAELEWPWYVEFCRWMSIGVLVIVFGLTWWLASLFLLKLVKEWVYALNDRRWGETRTRQKMGKV